MTILIFKDEATLYLYNVGETKVTNSLLKWESRKSSGKDARHAVGWYGSIPAFIKVYHSGTVTYYSGSWFFNCQKGIMHCVLEGSREDQWND